MFNIDLSKKNKQSLFGSRQKKIEFFFDKLVFFFKFIPINSIFSGIKKNKTHFLNKFRFFFRKKKYKTYNFFKYSILNYNRDLKTKHWFLLNKHILNKNHMYTIKNQLFSSKHHYVYDTIKTNINQRVKQIHKIWNFYKFNSFLNVKKLRIFIYKNIKTRWISYRTINKLKKVNLFLLKKLNRLCRFKQNTTKTRLKRFNAYTQKRKRLHVTCLVKKNRFYYQNRFSCNSATGFFFLKKKLYTDLNLNRTLLKIIFNSYNYKTISWRINI